MLQVSITPDTCSSVCPLLYIPFPGGGDRIGQECSLPNPAFFPVLLIRCLQKEDRHQLWMSLSSSNAAQSSRILPEKH